jgi:hypothetical protein
MASSSADCTLAGERLTSSARMMLAKMGPFFHLEGRLGLVVDHGADEVGRQEVGRELDALKIQVQHAGQGIYGEGLGQSRYPFEQDVALGEKAYQQAVDHIFLAYDDLADLPDHVADLLLVFAVAAAVFFHKWRCVVCGHASYKKNSPMREMPLPSWSISAAAASGRWSHPGKDWFC